MDKKLFENIGGIRPGMSVFDMSYEYKTTCDMGYLIPVFQELLIPGDVIEISHNGFFRTQPLVAPLMHNVNITFHTFSVPMRLLHTPELDGSGYSFENWITGGEDGSYANSLPQWIPSTPATTNAEGTLWDYMGFPLDIDPDGSYPTDLLRRAYYMIWNDYYRDEQIQSKLDITDETTNYIIKKRNWHKDYFTSARTDILLGTPPVLPVSIVGDGGDITMYNATDATARTVQSAATGNLELSTNPSGADDARWSDPGLTSTVFDIADLRLAAKLQQWMELNSRAGARYKEFIMAHYGIEMPDSRAQRPEFIGSSTTPLIVSEVLQTESSDASTPQGNLAGHGLGINQGYIGRYRATEYCIVLTLMSIMPKAGYQQGINRKWTYDSKYDYPFPEFMNLSEQAIIRAELYATSVKADNETIFGYQGIFDELRVNHDVVTNGFRSDAATPFDYWHLARNFGSAPTLNETFIACTPRKDIFAASSEPGFFCQIGNNIKMVRPIPFMANPGINRI